MLNLHDDFVIAYLKSPAMNWKVLPSTWLCYNCISPRLPAPKDPDDLLNKKYTAVDGGYSFMYPMWGAMLERWRNVKGAQIVLVSPFFHSDYIREVYGIWNNSPPPNIVVYTRKLSDANRDWDAWRGAVKEHESMLMISRPGKYFHAKFLAASWDDRDQAEMRITSA